MPVGRPSALEQYRCHCIKAARDLRYPPEVAQRLKFAKSEREMSNIMKDARKGLIK